MVLISFTSFELVLCNSYFGRNLEFLYFKNDLLNQVFDLIALLVRVCVSVYICVCTYINTSQICMLARCMSKYFVHM